MVGQTKQASSATTALIYITIGALMIVWSVVYYFWIQRREVSDTAYLVDFGFFFSGLVLSGIGFTLGRIARSAREAEVAATPEIHVNPPAVAAVASPNAAAQPAVTTNAAPNAVAQAPVAETVEKARPVALANQGASPNHQ